MAEEAEAYVDSYGVRLFIISAQVSV
jgi:hypothetical protein